MWTWVILGGAILSIVALNVVFREKTRALERRFLIWRKHGVNHPENDGMLKK